jgi:hypothetical protein
MFIFIRESERSKIDNVNLSNIGFVRRNHLPKFLINKKNHKINIPEIIITMKKDTNDIFSNLAYQSVAMLGIELKLKIINDYSSDNINDLVDFLIKNKEKDILLCWRYDELTKIIQMLIHKMLKYNIKLYWGSNPISGKHQINDYTSMWILNDKNLHVFYQYDITYNNKYQSYDIDYSKFKKEPLFSKQFSTSYLYNIINKMNIF